MKIGINEVLVHDHSGGAQQRELSLLSELLHQIDMQSWQAVVYISRDMQDDLLARLIKGAPCEVVRTPLPAIPTYHRILHGVPYWRKQVKSDNLSLFHTAYYPCPRLTIPTVFTVHDVRFKHMPATYTRWRRYFLNMTVPYTLRRATRIITVSGDTRNDLVQFWKIDSSRIDISYNTISRKFTPVADREQLERCKEKYNLPSQYILCVSHLEPRKNLHRLLQAYITMCSRHELPHYLVIMGKPIHGFNSLFEEVKRSGYTERILFTGFVDDRDIASVYSNADALVFPSLHEGFGMPAVEAMACGIPVVTSAVSALPEICGDAALYIDPYDVESMVEGMVTILTDRDRREVLVEKGLKRSRHFNVKKSAAAIIKSYRLAMGQMVSV